MVNHHNIIFYLSLLAFSLPGARNEAYAQSKITGRVLLQNDSTVAVGASVGLYSNNQLQTGTVTNGKGYFALEYRGTLVGEVQFTMVGCHPTSIAIKGSSEDIDLGDLYLYEGSEMLGEVVVSGQKEDIRRMLVFPEQHQLAASHDLFSLLQNMQLRNMSVNPMNKSASVNGKAIQWQIDGIPRTREDVVNINPQQILRIEYTDMPGIRYLDKKIGGVVNVVMKKRNSGGSIYMNGQVAFATGFGDGGIRGEYQNDKSMLVLDHSTSYRNYKKRRIYSTEKFINEEEEMTRVEDPKNSPFGYTVHNIDLNYIYQPNNKRQFSTIWRNEIYDNHNHSYASITQTHMDRFDRENSSHKKGYHPSLDLYFSNIFSNGGKLELNVVGTLGNGDGESCVIDRREEQPLRDFTNKVDYSRRSLISEVYYTQSLNPFVFLTAGYQNQIAGSKNTYYSPQEFSDRLKENNNYIFGQLSGRIDKFQYSVGTGMKAYIVDNMKNKRRFIKNKSSLSMMYIFNKHITANVTADYFPELPQLSQLTTVSQRYDDLQIQRGNPNLHADQNLGTKIGIYTIVNDKFANDFEVSNFTSWDPILYEMSYSPENKAFIYEAMNGIRYMRTGVKWKMKAMNLFHFLSIYTTLGYDKYNSDTGLGRYELNSHYWDVTLLLQHKEWALAYYYVKPKRSLYGNVMTEGENSSQLSLKYKKKQLSLFAAVLFPFLPNGATYASESYSKVNPKVEKVHILDNKNMLIVGFSWGIDFGKTFKQIGRSLNNQDSNNGVLSTSR